MAKFRQIRLPWTLNEQQHIATFRDFKSFPFFVLYFGFFLLFQDVLIDIFRRVLRCVSKFTMIICFYEISESVFGSRGLIHY